MRVRLMLAVCAVTAGLAAVAMAAVPLQRFIVKRGEETGFRPQGKPHLFRTARSWLAYGGDTGAQLATDTARLRLEGFVQALVQNLSDDNGTPDNSGGLSLVVRLGSPGAAKAEQGVELAQDIAGQGLARIHRFKVAGVPHARGFTVIIPGAPGSAANAMFTEGSCLLLLGDAIPGTNPAPPVEAGVKAIYRRTNGRCP
jgi:hypothetical protein